MHHVELVSRFYYRLVHLNELRSLFWAFPDCYTWSFIQFANKYMPGSGQYLLCLSYKDEFVGVAILNDVTGTHKCVASIWIEPRWRGHNTPLIVKQIMTYVHGNLKIKYIYAMSPHKSAQQLCSKVGFRSTGELVGFCIMDNRERDVEIFYSEAVVFKSTLKRDLMNMGWMENSADKLVEDIFKE